MFVNDYILIIANDNNDDDRVPVTHDIFLIIIIISCIYTYYMYIL